MIVLNKGEMEEDDSYEKLQEVIKCNQWGFKKVSRFDDCRFIGK